MSRLFVPLDVEFASDPKILEAGHTAAYLYIVALAHCKRTMNNGDIHRAQLRLLAAGLPGRAAVHAARLVTVELWSPIVDGWHVVAWEKHNASREEIETKRVMAAEDGERGAHTRWHIPPAGSPSAKCRICVAQRLVDSRPHGGPHSPPQWGPIAKEEVEPEVEVEKPLGPAESETLSLLPALAGKPATKRPPDELWNALTSELGEAGTETERSIRGKTVRELRSAHATPEQVHARCDEYRSRWPDMSLTDSALRKYWTVLAVPRVNGNTPKLNDSSQALMRAARRRQGESA